MFGIHDFGIFLTAGIVLTVTPGQDTFYIVGRSISQGRKAGIISVLGISTGGLIHAFAAALGLSAVLAAWAPAFLIIKLLGAAYLIFLGVKMLLNRPSSNKIPADFETVRFIEIYRQGLLTNLLNPKIALFFLAFVPQFISTDSPRKFLAFITLGLSFLTIGTAWCFCLAWFASSVGKKLRAQTATGVIINRLAGALFVLLGIRLAVTR